MDSKNIVCHVNSSACRVYVTFFYSTTSISFYKSFYTFRVFTYLLQLHFRGHFRVHLRTSTPTLIAAHHLPCFQGGKECMATLHSSDRDFTLLYILYILHLRLANIFVTQAPIYILHSTSTFSEHFRDPSIINIFANSAFKKNYSFP